MYSEAEYRSELQFEELSSDSKIARFTFLSTNKKELECNLYHSFILIILK